MSTTLRNTNLAILKKGDNFGLNEFITGVVDISSIISFFLTRSNSIPLLIKVLGLVN